MGLLKPATTEPGYLRAGILGFGGGGKTFTAKELAIGTRAYFGLTGPIAMFSTEDGGRYIGKAIREQTGKDLLIAESRSLDDLLAVAQECEHEGASVLIVDSITHPWREACDAYIAEINEGYKRKGWTKRVDKLEFQHYQVIKRRWSKWTDWYMNAPIHIIVCGRAGYEYDFEEDDKGKKELVKTGVKLKTEGEFSYEPRLLFEMQRVQVHTDNGFEFKRRAHVMKCCFDVLDGKTCDNPTFEFFLPHVSRLRPEGHQPIDTAPRTHYGVDSTGDDEWARERRQREVLAEEIQGELVALHPSQGADDKKARGELMFRFFDTRSWTKISRDTSSSRLREGLNRMRSELGTGVESAEREPYAEEMPEWASTGAAHSRDEGDAP